MANLQAYVDDSASEIGDRRLFLAGYINTADRWVRFSDLWQEELRTSPSIAYLKMSEANFRHGEFQGWSEPERDKKIKGLARVIRHFGPKSIHSSVSRSEVNSILKPVAPYGFSNPYFYCFQAIMIPLAYSQIERGVHVPIDFIFDEQEGLGEEARLMYELIRKAQPSSVQKILAVSPVFGNDKAVFPLQAADMLAWHIRRSHEADPNKFLVPSILSTDNVHVATDFNAERLQRMADGFRNIPGSELLKNKNTWKKTKREIVRQIDRGEVPSFRVSRWKNTFYSVRRRVLRFFGLSP